MSTGSEVLLKEGARVRLRGDLWIIQSIEPHADCRSLVLSRSGAADIKACRTFLLPFDLVHPVESSHRIRVAGRQACAHHTARAILGAHPFGALTTAPAASFDLLPFQLEPALAALRHSRLRILIADEVGLGKTIQAGILVRELAMRDSGCRALIATPAGVREQWQRELESRFSLAATIADTAWLASRARDLPADVNPWGLPGIYIASLDLVKRPEVLRALEDVTWDLVVVDEVHGAGRGTARLAAAHALGVRSRRVVLLTATPPDGDAAHFAAIADIGRAQGEPAITEFRRTRGDAGITSVRKTAVLPVRLSDAEVTLHRLLERYTSLVWREAAARHDARARLAAVILRKRALSSAAALTLSVGRRLDLLGAPEPHRVQQLLLPWPDEDPLDDRAPDEILRVAGLSDPELERRCLKEIAAAAAAAARHESKLTLLLRLVARIREPLVIFTEYRDTLAQIAAALPRDCRPLLLHGDLLPRERSEVQRAFSTSGAVLLATDAASEGLNLHLRCRIVIHFELPWTPMRLEQRTGRVDRLGQTRKVHEVLLVAQDTAERLVLAPLLKRARAAAARSRRLLHALDESSVAEAVMNGVEIASEPAGLSKAAESLDLRAEAAEEAMRLAMHRRLRGRTSQTSDERPGETCVSLQSHGGDSIVVVVSLALVDCYERTLHAELIPIKVSVAGAPRLGTVRETSAWAARFIELTGPAILQAARNHGRSSLEHALERIRVQMSRAADRERAIARGLRSTAQPLVQAGLFDRRALNEARRRHGVTDLLNRDTESRLQTLKSDEVIETRARIVALLRIHRPRT